MLGDGHQHFIARVNLRASVAVRHEVEAFGGITGEDDLLGMPRADKGAHRLACRLDILGRRHAERIQTAQGIGVVGQIEIPLGIQHARGALRRRGVVDVDRLILRKDREIRLEVSHASSPPFSPSTASSAAVAAAANASSSAMQISRSIAARDRIACAAARSMPRLSK